jgi:hypothetical protein
MIDGEPLEADLAGFMNRVRKHLAENATLGEAERAVALAGQALMGEALRRLVQERADREGDQACPHCAWRLRRAKRARARNLNTRFGVLRYTRAYRRCPSCGYRAHTLDAALGLSQGENCSPGALEACALGACLGPYASAAHQVARLAGVRVGSTTAYRAARREAERALRWRDAQVARAQTPQGAAQLAHGAARGGTLVIEIDAWNIRERGPWWGCAAQRRRQGLENEHWHWVYIATVFRLEARSRTAAGRAIISHRAFVATRQGVEALRQQLRVEALRLGAATAESILVLADGAAWIWNLAADLFPDARQRLDAFHAKQHLWALANALFEDAAQRAAWLRPLLSFLDRRKDGALEVIAGVEAFAAATASLTSEQRAVIEAETNYLRGHAERMDYKAGRLAGEPIGSGAIESAANRYQCRFKRTGQFWTLEGDEALLALETLRMNGRWEELYPFSWVD